MATSSNADPLSTILIIGASRGLGLGMAVEFLEKGWKVVGTVRAQDKTALHGLEARYPNLEIEHLDVDVDEQITVLHDRLSGRRFDILFVNAGTANRDDGLIDEVSTDEFVRVMVTNALSPMHVIKALENLVYLTGQIGVMSSGQGSIANNEKGGYELYRGTKAALNQFMRSYAARNADGRRSLVLMAPGWIRTDLGGPNAPVSMDEAIPKVIDVLLSQRGKPGLQYLDREGRTVPW